MSVTAEGAVHIFGVRHLSPGGAKHLLDYLQEVKPTAVLIEGPADATAEMRHLTHAATQPPVAILAFTDDLPVRTVLWPFAAYSPEYQAMKWAQEHDALAAFIDLPADVTLGLQELRLQQEVKEQVDEQEGAQRAGEQDKPQEQVQGSEQQDKPEDQEPQLAKKRSLTEDAVAKTEADKSGEHSIYSRIAELAGEHDYDMYWERNYEHNLNAGAYQEAILAFSAQMRELSEASERRYERREYAYNAVREAYMRRQINATIAAGHAPHKIVVVCGAYHASALVDLTDAMTDTELKALPRRSAKLTLMPYSYYKLSSMSGYGAGNNAPNYYEMMWHRMSTDTLDELSEYYLSMVARGMRDTGTHRSTAEVIEAVRLAEALAALHGGSAPTLRDLRDAAQTLLGRGELSVVADTLARVDVGTSIGSLADGVSQTPIQDDLNRLLKRLKLDKYKTAVATDVALDLRENRRVSTEEAAFLDLNRSFLLHRLNLIGITLAKLQPSGQDRATWAEHWIMQWSPEVEIQVVESTLLGETVEVAAAHVLQQKLDGCGTIAEASDLIRTACECGMLAQMEAARQTLQQLAADSRDVVQIAAAARDLSTIISYGDIRRVDTSPLIPLLEQLFTRACLFLLDCSGCNDEAANAMCTAMNEMNSVALDHHEHVDDPLWLRELQHLAERDDRNPRLSGFACAILMERNAITVEQCSTEVARRLSPGVPADLGAGWFEGLSQRNRYALLSRMSLWEQLSSYIQSLDDNEFVRALVFLRRAFSTFSPREKTMIAELLGELWGVHAEAAAEVLTGELKEDEVKMIDELNDFDFEDF
ncbi:DUF5682 family protein [Paenibacillus sp. UMB4589-SE434]|uniref:DUF5682 family protein n=1 Tax=Paenibacillus sp. UMB4589-SE434 TaxID=3046314 RepID=UPI002549D7B4|nr:DUF5682 family protein [Paenibacillus sp. UMB4589-SE434]MDK8183311.1 DUF5682 family protein [Paenibacillus sp. UMB4589-SE434]